MRVEPIPNDPDEFEAWCEEYDCKPLDSSRRAWCAEFGTYVRDAVAVGTTANGDPVLLYPEDFYQPVRRIPRDGSVEYVSGTGTTTRWRRR
jgi:hypothetical protein